jgi:spermidine synthase
LISIRSMFLAALAAFCVVSAPRQATAQTKTIHSEKSLYRNIFVTEDDTLRCLTFRRGSAGARQTCIKKDDPAFLVFPYTRMMMGALYLKPQPRSILVVGLGGGTLPMTLRNMFPDAVIDAVEIDAAVVKAARQFFGFKEDPALKVMVEDGRVFVKKAIKAGSRYDLIMLDAFEDDYIPEHLLTREFLLEVKSILAPDGVLAANTFSGTGLYDHESATYAEAFGPFYNLKQSNRVIWAQLGQLTPMDTLRENAQHFEDAFKARGIESRHLLAALSTEPDWPPGTRILTDQYSPSNILNTKPLKSR